VTSAALAAAASCMSQATSEASGRELRQGNRSDQAEARYERGRLAFTPRRASAVTAHRRGGRSRRSSPSSGSGAETGAPAGEERRVRYTLDLSREQHRFLKRYAFEAEIDASVVMRALLSLLEKDETVARRVSSELER
jgi:hypothetical protein